MSTEPFESPFTRIPNNLLDAILAARLGARQLNVLLAIIRKTYGYNKTVDEIGLGQLRDMTGIDKANLSRTVRELETLRIVTRSAGRHGHRLAVNTDSASWELPNQQPLPEEQRLPDRQPGVAESATEGVAESATKQLPNRQPQKKGKKRKTTPKEISHSLRERFEQFWAVYPRKRSHDAALKAFAKRNPDEQLFAAIMAGVARATTSGQWSDPKFIPHASTWLNAAGWLDDVQTAYSDAELAVIDAYNAALGDRLGRVDSALFVEARAGAIRALIEHLKGDIDAATRYFPAVRDRVELPPRVGFDYLIGPKGFGDVTGKLQLARTAGAAGPGVGAAWHTSWTGIVEHGLALGVEQGRDEPPFDFKLRVFDAAGDGPWWDDHNRAFRNTAGPVAAGALMGGGR
ncbi:replication protein [Burkholderia cenocepacia]|uniref:replication protein n=1 Tax=Burkholderia cenocepacia TaxID=95486 RepID=UPI002237F6B9|nr:replication protein [Burkholderia cenocepacia]MCW5118604.1 replication protein [Burkholderia cenocepacia]MCW5130915.1 replication protein [Burkholderia cenocepacia]MCW5174053.1 replication protein [Burkholderia cenocepacia]